MKPPTCRPPRLQRVRTLAVAVSLGCLGSACKPNDDPVEVKDTEEDAIPSPSTGNAPPPAGDGTADDTGPPQGTDTDDELVNGCLIGEDMDAFGFVHQCGGDVEIKFFASAIEFGDPFAEIFGHSTDESTDDTYAMPAVMACCDVYEDPPPAQAHIHACYKDSIETVCKSSVSVAESVFKDESIWNDLEANMASEQGQDGCQAALGGLLDKEDLWNPAAPPDTHTATWNIGTYASPFGSIVMLVEIDIFDPEDDIPGVFIPENTADYLECKGNDSNNEVLLLEVEDNPGFEGQLDIGDAVLLGPTYDINPVAANPTFTSDDTGCLFPLCSRILATEGAADLTVHNLSLIADGETSISDGGSISMRSEFLRIDLLGGAVAPEVATNKFEVPVGDALFRLGGLLDGDDHRTSATNASTLTIYKRPDGTYRTNAFSVIYKDAVDDTWTVTVSNAKWVPPT